MPTQANQPLPDGYQLQNYRIRKVLSCGGFSIVYLADDDNEVPVAIKEYMPSSLALRNQGDVLPEIAEENLAAFRYGLKCFFEEGKSLARLSHGNVVRVLNFFRANETVYMVMRYERGRTLQEHIQRHRGSIKEDFIRRVITLLLNGLREVHTHKLLHLDIKPPNIYIRNDGSPVLIDFGAARQTLTAQTTRLSPMYTPGFAAPEQYRKLCYPHILEYAEIAKAFRQSSVQAQARIFGRANVFSPVGAGGKIQDYTHEREWRVFADISLVDTPPRFVIAPEQFLPQCRDMFQNAVSIIPIDTLFEWGA